MIKTGITDTEVYVTEPMGTQIIINLMVKDIIFKAVEPKTRARLVSLQYFKFESMKVVKYGNL